MFKHVVFDWDGTLFDSVQTFHAADNAIAPHFGWPEVDFDYYQANMTRQWRSYYDKLLVSNGKPPLTDEDVERLHTLWHEAHESAVTTSTLLPGVIELLTHLQDHGITASICSMHPDEGLQRRIDAFELRSLLARVDGLPGKDIGGTSKTPHLRQHLQHLANIGIAHEPSAMMMVGDTHDDALAATELQLTPVLLTTGEWSRTRLESLGHAVHDSLTELLELLPTTRQSRT